jgi:hypothetical protein
MQLTPCNLSKAVCDKALLYLTEYVDYFNCLYKIDYRYHNQVLEILYTFITVISVKTSA